MSDPERPRVLPLIPAPTPQDDGIKQRYDNTTASGSARQLNGNIYNNNAGHSASGDARQYVGDVTNNTNYNYTVRKRRSDETLREDGRNRAFLAAAAEGQTPRVRHLFRLGVDLDFSDDNGLNALHHACLSGFEDVVQLLLDAGVDINAQSLDLGTPLCLAVLRERERVVELLLSSRASASKAGQWVGSPLHCASWTGSLNIVKQLLKVGADPMSTCAVRREYLEFTSYPGSSVPVRPSQSRSDGLNWIFEWQPLHIATYQGSEDLVDHFLKIGCPVDGQCRGWQTENPATGTFESQGKTYMKVSSHTALIEACSVGHYRVASKLILAGAVVDHRDSYGRTALQVAAIGERLHIHVSYLVDHGANVDAQNKWGTSPCHLGVWRGHKDVVAILIANGADLSKRDEAGKTPLFCSKDAAITECLLHAGANPSEQANNGMTALHLAARYGNVNIVKILLDYGAHPMAEDHSHSIAADYVPVDQLHLYEVLSQAERGATSSVPTVPTSSESSSSDTPEMYARSASAPAFRETAELPPIQEVARRTIEEGHNRVATVQPAHSNGHYLSQIVVQNEQEVADLLFMDLSILSSQQGSGYVNVFYDSVQGMCTFRIQGKISRNIWIREDDHDAARSARSIETIANSAYHTSADRLLELIKKDLHPHRAVRHSYQFAVWEGLRIRFVSAGAWYKVPPSFVVATIQLWDAFMLQEPYVKMKRSLKDKMTGITICSLSDEWVRRIKNRPRVAESETPDDHEKRLRRWAALFNIPTEQLTELSEVNSGNC